MDPIAATNVAAFAIQIVDFGAKVISKSFEIRNSASGATVINRELEQTTQDLTELCDELEKSMKTVASESTDRAILELGKESKLVAGELIGALKKLRGTTNRKYTRSFRLALLSVLGAEQIENLEKRLDRYRQQLTLRLVDSLRLGVSQPLKSIIVADCLTIVSEFAWKSYEKQIELEWQQSQNSAEILQQLRTRNYVGAQFLEWMQNEKKRDERFIKDLQKMLRETVQQPGRVARYLKTPEDQAGKLKSQFLEWLSFSRIRERHERIPKATEDTFKWIFSLDSFTNWMTSGTGVYWITGKPGSGKSTLMKFISDEKRTRDYANTWAGNSKPIMAGFYFWNSGTEIQMSILGLLRTLLHDIAANGPLGIMAELFPERWETLHIFGEDRQEWTLHECMQIVRRLKSLTFAKYRFFILIDGLDEFKGDHRELVDIVADISSSPHIKICVASRPWTVFQDAFRKTPSLMMQDLTRNDIETFTRSSFNKHAGFCTMSTLAPSFAEELFREVTERGSGVFLWVDLAVRSLLQGISNGDRLSDLRARLGELPDDLGLLFKRILRQIEPRYRKHAAELLLIHKAHQSPIPILQLSLADENNDTCWMSGDPAPLSVPEISYRCTAMKQRIDSRTLGLLNVDERCLNAYLRSFRDIKPEYSYQRPKCLVEYLHRTVRDWMETDDALSFITREAGPKFDPQVSLCKGAMLYVKYWNAREELSVAFQYAVDRAMNYAAKSREASREALVPLLAALHEIVVKLIHAGCVQFYRIPEGHNTLFPIALELDLDWWVASLLSDGHPTSTGNSFTPYAVYAMSPVIYPMKTNDMLRTSKCLELLLRHGVLRYDKEVIFKNVGSMILNASRDINTAAAELRFAPWVNIIELLVQYGADAGDLESVYSTESLEDQEGSRGIERWMRCPTPPISVKLVEDLFDAEVPQKPHKERVQGKIAIFEKEVGPLARLDEVIQLFDLKAGELVDDAEQKDYLACPFWKHNPTRYKHVKNVCTMGKGFKDLGKLTVEEVDEEKRKHMEKCKRPKVKLADSDPEWMDEAQDEEYRRLNFQKDKGNPVQCYSKICRALWGDSQNAILGPYHTPGFQLAVLRWEFVTALGQLSGHGNLQAPQPRQETAPIAGEGPIHFNQHVDPTLLSQLNLLSGNEPFYRGQHKKDSGVWSWDHTSDNQPNLMKPPPEFPFDNEPARDSPALAQTDSDYAGAWTNMAVTDGASAFDLDMDVDNEEDIL
ncbi:hypothetical protein Hte_006873 [Hypoxylon texense]